MFIVIRSITSLTVSKIDVIISIILRCPWVVVRKTIVLLAHRGRTIKNQNDIRRGAGKDSCCCTRGERFQLDPIGTITLRSGNILTVGKICPFGLLQSILCGLRPLKILRSRYVSLRICFCFVDLPVDGPLPRLRANDGSECKR